MVRRDIYIMCFLETEGSSLTMLIGDMAICDLSY